MGTTEPKSKTYVDYDVYGEIDSSGKITMYYGVDAILNAVRAWMASSRWSMIRRPSCGGKILPYLMKPMSDDNADVMQKALIRELENEFSPRIVVSACSVVPNYNDDQYEIHMEIYVPGLRDSGSMDVSLRSLVS